MKKKMVEIVTDEQLLNCVSSKEKVLFCYGDDCDDTDESVIVRFDDEIIKAVNESYYIRETCRFYTFEN
ncbi:hypothetical protein J4772_06335 [Cohnella sp. LGH]|uniref:hypothetical protein n=1 Tax=Cohnella sp. LGH TaxID=1619153 RepID=UPI001ADB955D|nr:hypothetical protein [Cohnella sp. LGH]QTH44019.1 hypothetical protein J4772_06335 [Cohnella sp. LGH]